MDDTQPSLVPEMQQTGKRRMNLGIIAWGIGSTVVTFVLVELIRSAGTDPMLFYVDYVIPGGAIGVGGVAGIGYGVGSWLSRTRLNRGSLVLMICLHLAAWILFNVAAWWRMCGPGSDAAGIGFWQWFDFMTRSIQFTEHGHTGDPVGGIGYLIRIGEATGFVLGGMIAPGILFAMPYCDSCQRYLQAKKLFQIPTAAQQISFARQATQNAADTPHRERAEAAAKQLHAAIVSGDSAQVVAAVAALAPLTDPKQKAMGWFSVLRHRCPGCGTGFIDFNAGNGEQSKRVERHAVTGDMLKAIEDVSARLPQLRAIAKP